MTWDQFVAGWAGVYDGYDVRHAAMSRRRVLSVTFRVAKPLASFGVRPGSAMVVSAAFSLAVPLLAVRGAGWPAIAALALLAGMGANTVASGLIVLNGREIHAAAFYQALTDRFGEACWLIALALLGAKAGLVFVVAGLVWAQEYIRARAGGAALRPVAMGTIGDRPTRYSLAVAALLLAAVTAPVGADLVAGAVTLMVMIWMALALIGLAQLLGLIRKVLAAATPGRARQTAADHPET